MAYVDLSEEDITSAAFAMQRAGVLEIVLHELLPSGFTLLEFLDSRRTPPRLVTTRHAIWRMARSVTTEHGKHLWSLPELGRLFNRDSTTILYAVRKP